MKNDYKIHFVGIGGIGVSSLARYFLSKGCSVSGSDASSFSELESLGIKVLEGHDTDHVPKDTDLLIYSTAVSENNPEIKEARRRGITIKSYPQALGDITKEYHTITVSGTHGKSTTTAMLALVLEKGGFDPTVIIGTKLKEFGGTNFKKGESKYLLIEADEWKAALLNYYPRAAIVTNIEEDHLDFYNDLDDIINTFKSYLSNNLQEEGFLVLNMDDKGARSVMNTFSGEVIGYSLNDKESKGIKLNVPGKHNLSNALAAFHLASRMGMGRSTILEALSEFEGTWRRFEEEEIVLENGKRVTIVNDYAHHPTEIKSTLQAAREKYPKKRITAVFQPHQYERTYRLFNEFKEAIDSAEVDRFLVSDIYTVKGRESEEIKKKVDSRKLCKETKKGLYSGDLENTAITLKKDLQEEEIVVIMGAGDVYNLRGYIKRS